MKAQPFMTVLKRKTFSEKDLRFLKKLVETFGKGKITKELKYEASKNLPF